MKKENLKLGQVFESKKDERVTGTVTNISEKVELQLNDGTSKTVAFSTLNRWWRLVKRVEQLDIENVVPKVDKKEETVQTDQTKKKDEVEEKEETHKKVETNKKAETTKKVARKQNNKKSVNKNKEAKAQHQVMLATLYNDILHQSKIWGCTFKQTPQYIGLVFNKRNIAEVYLQKKCVKLVLHPDSLSEEYAQMCKIVPKSSGWTLRASFRLNDIKQYSTALDMIHQGIEFRKQSKKDK